MNAYTYDLHMHSCLSPCADTENTPNNLAGMCALSNIQIAALTDHNSARNCPAFFQACKRYGVIPVAGMELTTSEDIHVVCIFETLEMALAFNDMVDARRIRIPNRPKIFGEQYILDAQDEIIGEEPDLLINATEISLTEVPPLIETYGGVCWPAHVDRSANGLLAILGTFPENPAFAIAELCDLKNLDVLQKSHPALSDMLILQCSDAHSLEQLKDGEETFLLEDEPYSGSSVRHQMFELLRRYQQKGTGQDVER